MKPRIASLLASGTEIVCILGLADQLVAISHECDRPPSILDRPRVTRARISATLGSAAIDEAVRALTHQGAPLYDIDVATLASLQPDVIITQSQCEVCAVSYEAVRTAVEREPGLCGSAIVDLQPMTLNDVFQDICKVGRACGAERASAACMTRLQQRLDAIRGLTGVRPVRSRPSVVCLDWLDPPMVAGHWMPDLVGIAGGRYDLAPGGPQSTAIPWDLIAGSDPEVLVLAPCGFDLQRTLHEAAALTSRPGWRDLRAVRGGRVFAVDGNAYFNRSGPRLVDSCEIMAHLLHPGLFAAPPAAAGAWQQVFV